MFGQELRRARQAAGLTQEELADAAGVHRTYVSLLERGKKSPTLAVLLKLGPPLGLSASELVARVERRRR